jgi:hypothetical protein
VFRVVLGHKARKAMWDLKVLIQLCPARKATQARKAHKVRRGRKGHKVTQVHRVRRVI